MSIALADAERWFTTGTEIIGDWPGKNITQRRLDAD